MSMAGPLKDGYGGSMATRKPLVSVITIFFNAERFIREAIESVCAQTYENWELLLVDDGSTDGSTQIAQRYAAQNCRKVRYLKHDGHQNRGMSASRNLGIREAKGQYVAFLDADDVYLAQKLERQVALLSAQSAAAMVYGASEHWYSWTGKAHDLGRDFRRKLGVPPDTLIRPPMLPILFLRGKAETPGTCSVLVRREAIERVGGFADRFRGMYEDQVFFFKLCLDAPVFVESGCWDRYRQHPDSVCATMRAAGKYDPNGKPNPALEAFLSWLEGYFAEQGVTDRELCKALQAAVRLRRHPLLYQLVAVTRSLARTENLPQRALQILRRALSSRAARHFGHLPSRSMRR
jgi:glycosyltransferase involved in cell wall biosynthesis